MAIDIVARGLAMSMVGSDGKIAADKMPTLEAVNNTEGFTPVGSLTDPSAIAGKTAEEVLLMMLFGVVNPTLTNPSLTVDLSSDTIGIVGRPTSLQGALIFNRGSISPAYGTSGFRAGLPTSYTIGANSIATSATTYNFNVDFTPTAGSNLISFAVNYAQGEQPKNSLGEDYGNPLPAGALSKTIVIQGVYQLYDAQGSVIDFDIVQDEDGTAYVSTYASESGGTKQSFSIAKDVTVIGIKQFNVMTQQWEWIGGSPEASLETFDTKTISGESFGETVEYVVYTHNGSARGARELRVYTLS